MEMKPKRGRPSNKAKEAAQLTISHWLNELKKDWNSLSPSQRSKLSAQIIGLLVNKMKALPASPEASRMNAEAALAELRAFETIQTPPSVVKSVVKNESSVEAPSPLKEP